MRKPGDKYRPSNGSEGEWFNDEYCCKCRLWKEDKAHGWWYCTKGIEEKSMLYNVQDAEYPAEWTYAENGKPTCTAFEVPLTPEELKQERIRKEAEQREAAGQLTLF